MKPTPPITFSLRNQRTFPLTDSRYQSTLEDARAIATDVSGPKLRPLWELSSGFFSGEAIRDYVAELFLFSVIFGVAAWPIAVALSWIPCM